MSATVSFWRGHSATSEAPAIVFGSQRITYAELEQRVQQAAAGLERESVRPGDRVVLLAHNHPDVVALVIASLRSGVWLALLNARFTVSELEAQAKRLRPSLLLASTGLEARLAGAQALSGLFGAARFEAASPVPRGAILLFTSGTGGTPKAVELGLEQLEASASASGERIGGAAANDRWLCVLPLFHIGGLSIAYRCIRAGSVMVLEAGFEAARAWELIAQEGITHSSLVPTTLDRLVAAKPENGRESDEAAQSAEGARSNNKPRSEIAAKATRLRAVLVGGGPLSPVQHEHARAAGLPVVQTYGLTEAASQVCTERPDEADGTTAGAPLTETELRIVSADGEPVPDGQIGEVEVRGPTVMHGYWNDPVATTAALRDGWLRTGDLGALDTRGRLRIEARRTDLILSGGENVYPAEVESVLREHPSIVDAVVVAATSAEWGQVPVAFIVRRTDERVDLEPWCRARLAGFKVPRRFVGVRELPRNAMGKVDRAALRAHANDEPR